MKRIGLLGGMTVESSVEYYRLINQLSRERLGGIHTAESIMKTVNFGEILPLMESGDWDAVLERLVAASRTIENGGADFLVICTNTMHKLADKIAERIDIPILNLIDAAAERILEDGNSKVGLLGTRFTMTEAFYRDRLQSVHGLEVLVPTDEEVAYIHRVIVDELTLGILNPESKTGYCKIIDRLRENGAEGVILGCTEIPLLIDPEDSSIPLYDTTRIHVAAAVEFALR